jgi:DNA-binding response OmpR family regulator
MAEPRKVILVEPETDAPSPLAEALVADGWDVSRTCSAAPAYQMARGIRPAMVIVRDPIGGGGALALLQRLRRSAATALVPVVAVIGRADGAREEFRRWGAAAAFDASASDAEIVGAVHRHATQPQVVTQAPDEALGSVSRLEALAKTGLLDTPPEKLFDRVSRLAAHLMDVPIVLMSLVDRHRQFFKSQVGLPEPLASARETPLSHSFCQWVVVDQNELIVPDARLHPLLKMNCATTEGGVVAYAGVPLRGGTSETIGSFCAVDRKPRLWEERELDSLRDTARVIEALTVLRQNASVDTLGLDDIRAASAVVGQAVHASARLLCVDAGKMTPLEHRELLVLTGDLGRQLAEMATAS